MNSEKLRVPKLRFKEFSGVWEENILNKITKIYDGTHTTPKYVEKGIPFYSVEHITANQFKHTKYISEEVFEKENQRVKLERNDILMTRIGDIGTSRLLDWDVKASFYVTLALIKQNKEFNSSFLNQSIKSNNIQKQLHSKTLHVAFPKKINLGEIGQCKVFLPSKDEQEKIASFLTSIDKKIEQLSKKDELLESYKKGVMQKIFSREIRFKKADGSDYSDWEEKRLGDIGEIVTGKTPSITDVDLWNGDIRFITPTDIDDNVKYQSITQRTVVKQNKMKVLPIGSIVYTCIASIGKMQLTLHPSITNQQINSIIVNINHNNEFIYYSLLNMTPYIKSTQSNTTLPIINKTEFSKFIVGIPSIQEQTKIANFLSSIDTKISQNKKALEETQKFKKTLLQQMFV